MLSWAVTDTLEISFVLDACKDALKHANPCIMNSDQGNHFTSPKYVSLFLNAGARISMDHRGRAYDNIFIERFWRSIKYEDIYLKDYRYPWEARQGIISFPVEILLENNQCIKDTGTTSWQVLDTLIIPKSTTIKRSKG